MTIHPSYSDFLAAKRQVEVATGIADPGDLPGFLFDHQRAIIAWALRRGRAAIFAGTGLGKTLMELVWAREVASHTERPALILAPLAVSAQHVREAGTFDIAARVVTAAGEIAESVIPVTNYQKMDRFDFSGFGGVALDESSILKNATGKYRTRLIQATRNIPFRLAATATPAPNDFMELGNHAEFLGILSYTDMLAQFFTHDGGETQKWRLKGHAEDAFWKWMATWAVMLRKPSDLGFDDTGYDLPPLNKHHHVISQNEGPSAETGLLFPMPASTLAERIGVRRETVKVRVDLAASITPGDRRFVWWCNLNDESALLARAIPGAVEVRGGDKDSEKERKLTEFSAGNIRVLVTKPSVAGFGMNWQHCADTGFVGLNDSFEQVYQAIRRFWRFGQENEVNAHFISAETEGNTIANLERKERDAERMAEAMVRHMADISSAEIRGLARDEAAYQPGHELAMPDWIKAKIAA